MVAAGRALSNYGGIFDPDPYPAYEGTPADAAGVLCNTRDEFIREIRKQCKRGVDLIKIADSTWGDVQTVADDEITAVVPSRFVLEFDWRGLRSDEDTWSGSKVNRLIGEFLGQALPSVHFAHSDLT